MSFRQAVAGSGRPGRGVWSSLTHPMGMFTQVSWLPLTCSELQRSPFQVIFCSLTVGILYSSVHEQLCVLDIKGSLTSRARPALLGSMGVSHGVCFII